MIELREMKANEVGCAGLEARDRVGEVSVAAGLVNGERRGVRYLACVDRDAGGVRGSAAKVLVGGIVSIRHHRAGTDCDRRVGVSKSAAEEKSERQAGTEHEQPSIGSKNHQPPCWRTRLSGEI